MRKPRDLELLSIVVPLFNEEDGILAFHNELKGVLKSVGYDTRIYYVNDGSTDGTLEALNDILMQDEKAVVIDLVRNFGHQAALSAGLDIADGDAVVTMDGDGQHPPDLIPSMVEHYEKGHDLVITKRLPEKELGVLKRISSWGFYKLINWISDTHIVPASSDFRLISREVVDALKKFHEYHRFLRGLIAWLGYEPIVLEYEARSRQSGSTKYSLGKMINLAVDAIFSFSLVPLRIALFLGLIFILLAFVEALYVVSFWIRGMQSLLAPGWSSLMFVLLFVGGSLMVVLAIVGSYVGYIFQEVKHRPVYVIKKIYRSEDFSV